MKPIETPNFSKLFKGCHDVKVNTHSFGDSIAENKIIMIYCETLVDGKDINQIVLPALEKMAIKKKASVSIQLNESNLLNIRQLESSDCSKLVDEVFDGKIVFYIERDRNLFSLDMAAFPNRTPEESNEEVTIVGAKDSFTEDLRTNLALIRKRLRTNTLYYEEFVIGSRSRTKVGLLYLEDLINPEILKEVRKRLKGINREALTHAMLKEAISDRTFSIFPVTDTTQRPELAMGCLINSRFVILMDGVPSATVGPTGFMELIKSAEDSYFPFFIVSLQRFLRTIAFIVALLIPGAWIALTSFHPEQLPVPLLATISMGRYGIPYSSAFETFLMQIMFELFREAGLRLPKAVGQTVAVVGGIMIGDAAISAGLTSPGILVVTAVSAVASFTLINPTLTYSVTLLKFIIMIFSSFFGFFGFFLSIFGICIYVTNMKSFGVPYLSPVSPLNPRELISAMFSKPSIYDDEKPSRITKSNSINRKRGKNDN
ncbi:spore germination protein [Pullulanibacillus sp. KACC 23026]|uniref:spore germination protein n=1 Tax=Pullulanibacillus sp. KACC 23026 TaxID=3028315 RepID=UPI0023B1DB87|nr:spore germination protein [Pullulanibacillus sp. KACC 23026]WEG12128.1 spore germination protein [Pullulanibacillus sp. KACC 23026]